MKIYLAARYSRHSEMREVRDVLVKAGHTVTSRWIDLHGGDLLESVVAEKLNSDPDGCYLYAIHDYHDLLTADVLIAFTSADGGGKGGRHVEFGMALAWGKRIIVVGPRENIFYTLQNVVVYDDFWRALETIG